MADDLLADRYRRRTWLGRGGMGEVWLCDDLVLGRPVAIKKVSSPDGGAPDHESVERILREARVAAQIHHPNTVAVFDLFTDRGQPYVVMEYVAGETLDERLRRLGVLAPHQAAKVIGETAAGLDAAHRAGIVHRDIKPANILIDAHDRAKLADFGIARAVNDVTLTRTGQTIGTLSYMAPEIMAGGEATPASDIWSLGATLYACTEGHVPHGSSSAEDAIALLARRMHDPVPPPHNAGPATALLLRMLAGYPADRPTAGEVARVLAGSIGSEPPTAAPVAATTRLDVAAPPGWNSAATQTAIPADLTVATTDADPVDGVGRIWSATYTLVGIAAAAVIALVAYLLVRSGGDSADTGSGGQPPGSTQANQATQATQATRSTPSGQATDDTVRFEGVTVSGATDLAHRPGVTSAGGPESTIVHYRDLVVGDGASATPTATVTVHYVGVLFQAGTTFDDSWARSEPATFSLPAAIPGLVQGVAGDAAIKIPAMKAGGRRVLIIPPAAAYGSAGSNDIPPNAALVFVVDLLSVQ